MASDFHTHHHPAPGIRALYSGKEPLPGTFNSLELHPWHLPERFAPMPELAERLRNFDALGEIGLDSLRGPALPVQREFLQYGLRLAKEAGKPVVLHVVRCFHELPEMLRRWKLRVMVHGFRGSAELLDELWRQGITVSLHPSVLDREDILRKLEAPTGAFGFESDDDAALTVADILARGPLKNAERMTDQYFADFLETGT